MAKPREEILANADKCKRSRKLVLMIVFLALLLDNMLLTTIVPIIPNFLYSLEYPEDEVEGLETQNLNITDILFILNPTNSGPENFALNETLEGPGLTEKISKYLNETSVWERDAVKKDKRRHDIYSLNARVGLIFASKAFVQLLITPFIGPLTNKIGYSIPILGGFIIIFVSTVTFAFARSYTTLFLARAVQGVGSACSSVSGMGMLADSFPDDRERGQAMGFALGGMALGVLVGPPFGGILYQFAGMEVPFLILAGMALVDGVLILTVLRPRIEPEREAGTSWYELLRDPYILLTAGAVTIADVGLAMLDPTLPLWMLGKMHASEWEQGIAFLPATLSYLIGTNIFGPLAHVMGRWLSAFVGMIGISVFLVAIPFAENIFHLVAPIAGMGFAIGMVDSAMMPMLGHLVDIRHVSVYGSVYAMGDMAFCVGFTVGPALSGYIVQYVGFNWMLGIIAAMNILFAPLLIFLRNPPTSDESTNLLARHEKTDRINYIQRMKSRDDIVSDEEERMTLTGMLEIDNLYRLPRSALYPKLPDLD